MKSKSALLVILVLLVGSAAFFINRGNGNSSSKSSDNRLAIIASFYPMAEFSRQVGGDKVSVDTLVAPGVEPHDYEPSPKDLVQLRKSRLFVYNGAGLEPWQEKVTADLNQNTIKLVDASKGLKLLALDHEEEADENTNHTDELSDPHVWLDPVLAQKQVTTIKDALIAVDAKNAEAYEANADAYINKLSALDKQYRSGLAQCERRTIVTSHQAFSYLADRYDIDIQSINGLSPEAEPTPQKLAEVAEAAKANNVRYIFFETLASPKLSKTIAREIGAETLVLNPLEGLTDTEVKAKADYISVQKQNLSNLRLAMGCK